MTFCRTRTLYGRSESNAPSRFLAEVDEHAVVHERLRSAFAGSRPGDRRPGGDGPGPRRPPAEPPARPVGAGAGEAAGRGAPKEDLPLLATGDTVRHRAWGEGVVIQVATAEEVVVRFPEQGEKRLHVAYAPIEKV